MKIQLSILVLWVGCSASSSFAQGPGGAEAALCRDGLHVRATDYQKFKPGTVTADVDQFIQVMEEGLLHEKNPKAVRSMYFNGLVQPYLNELKNNHISNYDFMKQDSTLPEYTDRAEKNYKSVTLYITRLEKLLGENKPLSYFDYLVFSDILLRSRNRLALDELEKLYESPQKQKLTDRYPTLTREYVGEVINEDKGRLPYFWAGMYLCDYDFSPTAYETYRVRTFPDHYVGPVTSLDLFILREDAFSSKRLAEVLLFPLHKPTGNAAFYSTFHLPASPAFMARSYEIIDNNILVSPFGNYVHDLNHFINTVAVFFNSNGGAFFEGLGKLGVELKKLKDTVVAKDDKHLLNTLYFLFYYMKFETGKEARIDLDNEPFAMIIYLVDMMFLGHVFHSGTGKFTKVAKEAIHSPRAPAPDLLRFGQNISEILRLMEYQNLALHPEQNTQEARAKIEIGFSQRQQEVHKFKED